uniref:Uncharacterized protein n=1 Tax=Mustela putorius furo TaxID=9669 RepID=M3Y9N4_MUSPF
GVPWVTPYPLELLCPQSPACPQASPDAIAVPKHDLVPVGPVHVQVNFPDVLGGELGLLLHFQGAESGRRNQPQGTEPQLPPIAPKAGTVPSRPVTCPEDTSFRPWFLSCVASSPTCRPGGSPGDVAGRRERGQRIRHTEKETAHGQRPGALQVGPSWEQTERSLGGTRPFPLTTSPGFRCPGDVAGTGEGGRETAHGQHPGALQAGPSWEQTERSLGGTGPLPQTTSPGVGSLGGEQCLETQKQRCDHSRSLQPRKDTTVPEPLILCRPS